GSRAGGAVRRKSKKGQQKTPDMRKFLSLAAGLSFLGTANAFGTDWPSDGSEANVQAIHDTNAHDGDTITLPAGTFIWTVGVNLIKGITVRGQTTITGAGTATCTADDQTIIIDQKLRSLGGGLISAFIPAGKSFRLTGVTLRHGTVGTVHSGGAVAFVSSGGLASSVRMDHCHLDNLIWEQSFLVNGWIYGVDDHNWFQCGANQISHVVRETSWNNQTGVYGGGHGSWRSGEHTSEL